MATATAEIRDFGALSALALSQLMAPSLQPTIKN